MGFSKAILVTSVALVFGPTAWAGTLDDVKARGTLRCGLSDRAPGFSLVEADGVRKGFEVDFCDAVAAAIFGEAKVEYVPLLPKDAFSTLKSGAIDLFADRAAWTFLRDASLGFSFAAVYFYDGQGFMVPKDLGLTSAKDLGGATICTTQGTNYELNLADWMKANSLEYSVLTFTDFEEARRAYEEGRCDSWTSDVGNFATRGTSLKDRGAHVILPEVISREPLGPMVRDGDDNWRKIVFWVQNARIAAEEFGITQANVEEMKATSANAEIQRFLGVNGDFGEKIGLSNDWAVNAIKATGNYAETWAKHLGPETPLGLARGQSSLVRDGGLLYPVPFR